MFFFSIFFFLIMQLDEVWISSVERAQLSPIPLLEDTTSMVTGAVLATYNASDAQVRNKRMQYAKVKQCK